MKRFLPLIFLSLAVLGFTFFILQGAWFFWGWNKFLVVSLPLEKADTLIVLGGEAVARPLEAARLFKADIAPRIFVTGIGDARANSRILMREGVPSSAITIESKATTTYSNATLLKPLLEAARVRSALIVTSPFHTRRALATFRKVIPGVRFGVVSASIGWWNSPQGRNDLNRFATIEIVKTLGYWLLYGVSPVLEPEPSRSVPTR